MVGNDSSRRSVLKSTAATIGVGLGTSGLTSADDGIKNTERNAFHNLTSERIDVGSELRELTPHWTVIGLPRKAVTKALAKSDTPKPLVEQYDELLKDLRRTYPVRRPVEQENSVAVRTVELAKPSVPPLDEVVDLRDFQKLVLSFSGGVRNNFEEETGDVQTEWAPRTHRQLTRIAAEKEGYASPNTIGQYADDPDFDDEEVPDWAVGDEKLYFRMIKSYKHYYNPSTTLGTAPSNGEQRLNEVKYAPVYDPRHEALGRGSHYLADVCQPLHTGMEVEQGADYGLNKGTGGTPIHYQYENYVRDEWTNDTYGLKEAAENDTEEYTMTDPSQFMKGQAIKANQYTSTVFYAISGQLILNWQKDVKNLTQAMVKESVRGIRAGINYTE